MILTGHWVHELLRWHHLCAEKQQKQSMECCLSSKSLSEVQISQTSSLNLSYYSLHSGHWHAHGHHLCQCWHYGCVVYDVLGCGFDVDCDSGSDCCSYCLMSLVFYPYLHAINITLSSYNMSPKHWKQVKKMCPVSKRRGPPKYAPGLVYLSTR